MRNIKFTNGIDSLVQALVIGDYLMRHRDLTSDDVFRWAASEGEIPLKILLSSHRGAYVSSLRQVACYVLHTRFGVSYAELGRRVGHTDHTSVKHGVEKVARSYELYAQQVEEGFKAYIC